jgi:hypothetical protein
MSRAFVLALAAATAMISACATSPAGPCNALGTSVCGVHVENFARDIAGWHNRQNPACPYVRPLRARIIRDEVDAVVEHWTVQACESREFTYRAYLLPSAGSLSVMVTDVSPDDGPP